MSDVWALRNVSDTALVTAAARAHETHSAHPVILDPLAALLAGARGEGFTRKRRYRLVFSGVIARTAILDEFILQAVKRNGATCVVNLGAGLDTRPYRLDLPKQLRWIEADLPPILDYKEKVLGDVRPGCRLERHGVDLSDTAARRALLDVVPGEEPTVAVTEGVVPYLEESDVAALATDLAKRVCFRWWVLDLVSAPVVRLANLFGKRELSAADARFRFGPKEGGDFFLPLGWEPVDVRTSWLEQRRLDCEPWSLRVTWKVSPQRLRDAIGRTGVFVLLKRRA